MTLTIDEIRNAIKDETAEIKIAVNNLDKKDTLHKVVIPIISIIVGFLGGISTQYINSIYADKVFNRGVYLNKIETASDFYSASNRLMNHNNELVDAAAESDKERINELEKEITGDLSMLTKYLYKMEIMIPSIAKQAASYREEVGKIDTKSPSPIVKNSDIYTLTKAITDHIKKETQKL